MMLDPMAIAVPFPEGEIEHDGVQILDSFFNPIFG